MRMTIVRDDNLIIIDGVGYYADLSEFDNLSWIPDYDLKTWGRFHALQWYGYPNEDGEYGFNKDFPHGEIEFKKPVPNFIIAELGVYERAITLWEESKIAEEERIKYEESERLRLQEEQEAALRDMYIYIDADTIDTSDPIDNVNPVEFDLETLLSEL
jgi:hypothetical protein